MRSSLTHLTALLFLTTIFLTGCVPAIGDSCKVRSDCPSGAVCDSTVPNGYCTIPECTIGSCPNESICVEFDEASAFCMKFCEDDSDCRDGYVCRDEPKSRSFCYVAK